MLFCERCAEIVPPSPLADKPRFCACRQAACWWVNPVDGIFKVWAREGKESVSVLGLHNGLLFEELTHGLLRGDQIERLLAETAESYLFKQVNSLIIRCRPGYSS